MLRRSHLLALVLGLCVLAGLSSCGTRTPLQPVNHSPVVESLIAFPTTIAFGDSAIVVCHATDPDGDRVVFDWYSDSRLTLPGASGYGAFNRGNTLVVRAGAGARAPLDTGWVSCEARDSRGGGAYAGTVRIVIRQ